MGRSSDGGLGGASAAVSAPSDGWLPSPTLTLVLVVMGAWLYRRRLDTILRGLLHASDGTGTRRTWHAAAGSAIRPKRSSRSLYAKPDETAGDLATAAADDDLATCRWQPDGDLATADEAVDGADESDDEPGAATLADEVADGDEGAGGAGGLAVGDAHATPRDEVHGGRGHWHRHQSELTMD